MGEIKGYLVKGTWRGEGGSCDVYAYWWTLFGPAGEVQWCDDRARATERGRLLFPTVNEADAARSKSSHLSDVGIFRVYADGREERLPDLEEALAEIERLRQENMDDRGMYDAQLANVAHERDEARAEIARLNAELAKLRALKSAEVADIGAAILRAWPEEQKVTVGSIPPEVAAVHRTEREVDFAEIEAWLTRFEDIGTEGIADMDREDLETDLEVATASYVPALLDEVQGAENALLRAGIPDDGRPLAERIATLDARLAGTLQALDEERRGRPDPFIRDRDGYPIGTAEDETVDVLETAHAALDPIVARRDTADGPPLSMSARAATAVRIAQEAIAARDTAIALFRNPDGTLGEHAEGICRLADILRGKPITVEHRCEDPAECPLCMAVAETDPAPKAADIADPLADLAEEQRQHLTTLASDPAFRARFNGSRARIVVLNAPTPLERRGAARMREYINGAFGLTITVKDLATALGISEADIMAIEAGTKSTDAAGWLTMQTACFNLGSGTKAEHIADPTSSPAFQRAMEEEALSEPVHYAAKGEPDCYPTACGLVWKQDARFQWTDNADNVQGCPTCESAAADDNDEDVNLADLEASFGAGVRAWGTPEGQRFLREMRGGLNEHGIDREGKRLPLTMIIAIARNGVIGKGADLPWRIPEDLRHFKRETIGHTLIVGRKTFEVLPGLPWRKLVVVTRANTSPFLLGWERATTIEAAIARARQTDPHPIVIGGAEVYRAAMPFATRILLTEIDHNYEGDVRFELDRTGFVETSRRAGETPGVSFVTLERKADIANG